MVELPMIRIPEDRIGALIGPGGETKEEIEERSGVRLDIDSGTGEVLVDDENCYDPILALQVQDVVKAIGRGFSPEKAFRLWQMDAFFDMLDLREYVGDKRNQIQRVKGRIIGEGGRTREHIEAMTDVHLTVYGTTVAFIGEPMETRVAREAVVRLIEGAEHSAVYKFLEDKRRELRMKDLGLE
ncbi:RNA-processing protein [Thermoplasmatales archaeon SW_10_69_26]|nr:MAG: RNA-processing protein [Thermoplasmatales archaeon SW_10_69_26]